MKKAVTVRKARTDELKVVQDLNHELFLFDSVRDPELNLEWPYQQAGEDYFKGMIAGTIGVCFVAELDGTVVGYLAGSRKLGDEAYRPIKRTELENVFVRDKYRGSGVGTALVQAFVEWSHSKGIKYIFVEAYALNEKAVMFYQKVGFAPRSLELEMSEYYAD